MVVYTQDNIEGTIPRWLSNYAARKVWLIPCAIARRHPAWFFGLFMVLCDAQAPPGYVKQLEKAAVGLLVKEGRVTPDEARTLWRY